MQPLLTADWTNLVVATFQVDKKALAPWVPFKTELNDWNGNYYMSLLGFIFSKPMIAGIPSPFFRRFEELNLRFYIRYKHNREWKKGVVFIREIVPSPIIGLAAKFLYRENFVACPMKHADISYNNTRQTTYYWKTNQRWNHLQVVSAAIPSEPSSSSLEAFTRDHYWACTKNTATKTKEFGITHPHWNIYPGLSFDMQLDAETMYGEQLAPYFQQDPSCFYFMDGSTTGVSYPALL